MCAQRFVHWSGKAEDGLLDYYDQDPEHREWTGDDFLARQEAGRLMTAWFTGLVLWGLGGAVALFLVWRRERAEGADLPDGVA